MGCCGRAGGLGPEEAAGRATYGGLEQRVGKADSVRLAEEGNN